MPFTLVIRSRQGLDEGQACERVFDQSVVAIGRAAGADVVLKDPQRMVSSRHGEIRRQGASWVLVDLGSTNGTKLNEVRLTARNEYGLKDGDRIKLGDFLIIFKTAIDSQEASAASEPVHGQRAQPVLSDETQTLLYLLRRAYADAESVSQGSRQEHVQKILRQTVGQLDRQSARSRLESLRARLSESSGSPEPERPRPVAPPPSSIPSPRRDRIEQVLHVVCGALAAAIKGRREFQREFEVEASRILDWTPNPIKHAETAEEIASLLLNPRTRGLSDEQAMAHLHDVFQDLTLHQLGLMAGFRECVRGLLKEFDPASLMKGDKGRLTGKGLGLLDAKGVRTDAAAWRRFLEKYRQLTEEEVRVFERILAPHFAKGYLSIQQTRGRT